MGFEDADRPGHSNSEYFDSSAMGSRSGNHLALYVEAQVSNSGFETYHGGRTVPPSGFETYDNQVGHAPRTLPPAGFDTYDNHVGPRTVPPTGFASLDAHRGNDGGYMEFGFADESTDYETDTPPAYESNAGRSKMTVHYVQPDRQSGREYEPVTRGTVPPMLYAPLATPEFPTYISYGQQSTSGFIYAQPSGHL